MSIAHVETRSSEAQVNVGDDERLVSKVLGGGLMLLGLDQRSFSGLVLAAIGGAMLYRGITGNCQLYRALNIDTSDQSLLNHFETQEEAPDLT